MIAGIGRRTWSLLALPLVMSAGGLLTGSAQAAPPTPAPPTPAYSPPAREPSPFSSPDVFCDPDQNHFEGVAATDARLAGEPISVVVLNPATGVGDAGRMVETFAALITKCGGIGGRPVEMHVVPETGDPAADCLAATRQFSPLIVVTLAPSKATPCIVHDQHTIVVSESAAANTDLASTGGRLAATDSSEGLLRARIQGLADSGALDGRAVAILPGNGSGSVEFLDVATAALRARKVSIVSADRADTLLERTLDPARIVASRRSRRDRPFTIYDVSDPPSQALDQLRTALGSDPARTLRNTAVYSFGSIDDPSSRGRQSPSSFSQMCTSTFQSTVAKTGSSSAAATTTTDPPDAPPSLESQRVADVCLAMRVVVRALFSAGIDLTPRSAMTALHRLPYIDSTAPGGTPKPRPNQVVNEPVRRIEQVVGLTQAQTPCTSDAPTSTTTTTTVASICWTAAPGWEEGGHVVNVPLTTPTH